MRDEVLKLEQKLIRLRNFKLNSSATPALNDLLLVASTLKSKGQEILWVLVTDCEKQIALALFSDCW